jgi:hypothetical protein
LFFAFAVLQRGPWEGQKRIVSYGTQQFLLLSLTHFFFFFFFKKSKTLKAKCVAGNVEKVVAISTPSSMSVGEFGAAAFKQASKSDARFCACTTTVEVDYVLYSDEANMLDACSGAEGQNCRCRDKDC